MWAPRECLRRFETASAVELEVDPAVEADVAGRHTKAHMRSGVLSGESASRGMTGSPVSQSISLTRIARPVARQDISDAGAHLRTARGVQLGEKSLQARGTHRTLALQGFPQIAATLCMVGLTVTFQPCEPHGPIHLAWVGARVGVCGWFWRGRARDRRHRAGCRPLCPRRGSPRRRCWLIPAAGVRRR